MTLQDRVIQEFGIQDGQTLVVGRGAEADVVIDNTAVSRRHVSLQVLNGTRFAGDLGSSNGTQFNGTKVTVRTAVDSGDVVTIGKFRLEPVPAGERAAPWARGGRRRLSVHREPAGRGRGARSFRSRGR